MSIVFKQRRGLMMVISSPSGAGKTSLSRRMLEHDTALQMSVSATTRSARQGEVSGEDYFFVTPSEFDRMVREDVFLEWATVFENRYGTPRGPVDAALDEGRDVLFDIDWQGTQQLKDRVREDVVTVFILPPSMAQLEDRLRSRSLDSADVIAGRMAKAGNEISHWAEYDYVLINDDFDACLSQLRTILAAERLKRRRQPPLADFVKQLLATRD
jgi:guanylate kinase